MQSKIRYDFSAQMWKDSMPGGWVFISLPKPISNEIRKHLQFQEEGWGRMKASAIIQGIEWDTAIWYDKKMGTYLLPVRADIRKKGNLELGETLEVSVFI